ncbi:MAG: hypothetical protein JKY65_27905 [Planctomycetes bacterium]|nr:hypothetical protein [Planctomycetota bacterium]
MSDKPLDSVNAESARLLRFISDRVVPHRFHDRGGGSVDVWVAQFELLAEGPGECKMLCHTDLCCEVTPFSSQGHSPVRETIHEQAFNGAVKSRLNVVMPIASAGDCCFGDDGRADRASVRCQNLHDLGELARGKLQQLLCKVMPRQMWAGQHAGHKCMRERQFRRDKVPIYSLPVGLGLGLEAVALEGQNLRRLDAISVGGRVRELHEASGFDPVQHSSTRVLEYSVEFVR